jgi:hypothetical protein
VAGKGFDFHGSVRQWGSERAKGERKACSCSCPCRACGQNFDLLVARSSAEFDGDSLAGTLASQRGGPRGCELVAVEHVEDVPWPDTCLVGGSAFLDRECRRPAGVRQPQFFGDLPGDFARSRANEGVLGGPVLMELVCYLYGGGGRDGEAECDGPGLRGDTRSPTAGGASMVFVKRPRVGSVAQVLGRGFRLGAWRRARLSDAGRGR